MCFVDAAYRNDPTKRRPTTLLSFKFSRSVVVYKSRTQYINMFSYTESKHIAAVEIGFTYKSTTPIDEGNDPTIDIVNSSITTERTHHIDVRLSAIQYLKEYIYIIMHNISSIINTADDLTKPLGWVLHYGHAIYLMGH